MFRSPFGIVLAQIFGIILADCGWLSEFAALLGGAASLLLGCAARRGPRVRAACVGLACTCAGALALVRNLTEAQRFSAPYPMEVTLEASVGTVAWRGASFAVDFSRVVGVEPSTPPLPRRVRLYGERTPENFSALELYEPGDRIRARVRLYPARGLQNPGGRDAPRTLRRAGIGARARLVHPALHVQRAGEETLSLMRPLQRLRRSLVERFDPRAPGSALLLALALGDRSGLSPELERSFITLGVAHVLSVSGLHIVLVAALVFAICRRVLVRARFLAERCDVRLLALWSACAVACAYALLTGFDVPARRALLMLGAFCGAVSRRRVVRRGQPLALAAMSVLALEPQALFSPGAQLSFAATAALVFFQAPSHAWLPGRGLLFLWSRRLLTAFRVSCVAVAATQPLTALHFGRTAPFGLFFNLLVVPWTTVCLLPVALSLALLLLLLPEAGITELAQQAARTLAVWTEVVLTRAAEWLPRASGAVQPPPLAWGFAVLAAGAAVRARGTLAKFCITCAGALLLHITEPREIAPPPPRAVFLDVGHGDAALLQGRSGTLLVDAGLATPDLDLGAVAVVPALRALGVARIDVVAVSHADLDHRGGIPAVLREFAVAEMWLPFGALSDPAFASLLELASVQGVRVQEQGQGSAARRVGDWTLLPLWPPEHSTALSRNDRSLVLRAEVGGRHLLLAGDLEVEGERALLASGIALRAEILKLSHHGSRTSSTENFLAAVRPQWIVVSAACDTRSRGFHASVEQRLRQRGLTPWWTGRDGAVLIHLREPLWVKGWRELDLSVPCRESARSRDVPR